MGKLQGNSRFFVPGPPAKPGDAYIPIVKFLLKELRGNTVIDLGGGEGAYALEIQKAGYDVVVADVNAESLSVAEKNGLKTRLLSLEENLGENQADAIVLIEVLEHVLDPVTFLKSAIGAAKKRVIFTLPCTNDFVSLFNKGLTYNHIAVSDHLWHFSYDELKCILDSLDVKYRLSMGDYLFPTAATEILRECFRSTRAFITLMHLYGLFNKMGLISNRYPSRFYGVIEKS